MFYSSMKLNNWHKCSNCVFKKYISVKKKKLFKFLSIKMTNCVGCFILVCFYQYLNINHFGVPVYYFIPIHVYHSHSSWQVLLSVNQCFRSHDQCLDHMTIEAQFCIGSMIQIVLLNVQSQPNLTKHCHKRGSYMYKCRHFHAKEKRVVLKHVCCFDINFTNINKKSQLCKYVKSYFTEHKSNSILINYKTQNISTY